MTILPFYQTQLGRKSLFSFDDKLLKTREKRENLKDECLKKITFAKGLSIDRKGFTQLGNLYGFESLLQ